MRRRVTSGVAATIGRACSSSSSHFCDAGISGRNASDALYQRLSGQYVSFDACSANAQYGLHQAPLSEIGKNLRECDPTAIQVYVVPNMVSEEEERLLKRYSDMQFDRLPFEKAHEDALIHHYKEFYRPACGLLGTTMDRGGGGAVGPLTAFGEHLSGGGGHNAASTGPTPLMYNLDSDGVRLDPPAFTHEEELTMIAALERCREAARRYLPVIPLQERVHFIRIHGEGFIRAHVDESRNSSGIVSGLTLNTGRVMSLTNPKQFPGARVDMLLAPRSFYLLTGSARYNWLHSVDWTADDAEHLSRMRNDGRCAASEGSEVVFNGIATGLQRGVRTGIILRGVSPMELLMRNRNGTATPSPLAPAT